MVRYTFDSRHKTQARRLGRALHRKARVIRSGGHKLYVIGHEGKSTVLGTRKGKSFVIGTVPTKYLPKRHKR